VSSDDTEVGAGERFKENEVAKWETIWRDRWRGSCPSVESSRKPDARTTSTRRIVILRWVKLAAHEPLLWQVVA
jgi:hypothetical protein